MLSSIESDFCEWHAKERGISLDESQHRYIASRSSIKGGFGGVPYRDYCVQSHNLGRVWWDDTREEVIESYKAHARMHLLRMLSYKMPPLYPQVDDHLSKLENPTIVDFGCGLAQMSRHLAKQHQAMLVLMDIPTTKTEFLTWLCRKQAIDFEFIPCGVVVDVIARCDLCVATSVLEHIHDATKALDRMCDALRPGGILYTDVRDAIAEYMHVTPRLSVLRDLLLKFGFTELVKDRLYQNAR